MAKRILGTRLYEKIDTAGVFDRVNYHGPNHGQPGVFFTVVRGPYAAFIRWHSEPVAEGYGAKGDRSSRISCLSVKKDPEGCVLIYDVIAIPRGSKRVKKEHAKDPDLKKFLEDIVTHFHSSLSQT